MKVLFFGNNRIAPLIAQVICAAGDEIVGVVLHPEGRRRYGDEIVRACGAAAPQFDGSQLTRPDMLTAISALNADIGVSALFGYILREPLLKALKHGVLNIHPAFLPFNRGANPNVWSIIEGTPAGVTLHWIDKEVDTGAIVAQVEVAVEPIDTGATLYSKLEQAGVDLFKREWPRIRRGELSGDTQPAGGTSHRLRDLQPIDEIDLEREYNARKFIDLLRARTFPPYEGAYFMVNGRKVLVRIQLEYEAGPAAPMMPAADDDAKR